MRFPKKLIKFTAISAFLIFTQLSADLTLGEQPLYELDPYVVVATRTPLSPLRVSPSIAYIGSEEMVLRQDVSLIDVLERQAGINLKVNGSIGSVSSMFIRGTNSDNSAIFLDGRRLNAAFSGQYDLESLSLNNIDSVQLMKSGSTVNYGSSGIGGVVDLRTKTILGNDIKNFSLEYESGSDNFDRAMITASVASDNSAVSFARSKLSTDNERENDYYENNSSLARLDFRITDNISSELIIQSIDNKKGVPGSESSPSLYNHSHSENLLISPGLRFAKDNISAHLFYSKSEYFYDYDYSFFGSLYNSRSEIETDELSLQIDYNITDTYLLTVGGLYHQDEFIRPGSYRAKQEQFGAFTQLLSKISDSFELRSGVRYDDFSNFKNSWTGNVEAIYDIPSKDLILFGKVATSYSPPTAQDLAFDENLGADNSLVNTQLNPEKGLSYELGIRHSPAGSKVQWSLVLFRNEIDDLIQYVGHPALYLGPGEYDYAYPSDTYNVKSASIKGVEFSFDYSINDTLGFIFNYTYLDAVGEDYIGLTLNDFDEFTLPYRPRHLMQLTANYLPTDKLRVGLSAVRQIDRQRDNYQGYNTDMDDFLVVNLVADLELTESLSVFGRIDNLLDKSYALTYDYPALGRSVYFGARKNF